MPGLISPRSLAIAMGIGALVTGCGVESATDHGTASAELTVVPANVLCLRFQLSGSTSATKDFSVAAGTSSVSLDLGILAPGSLTVSAYAYNVSCGSITPATTADWVGGPVTVTITAGMKIDIPITLMPNTPTTGTVDFVVPVQSVVAGAYTTYALLQDGTVKAWGHNSYGQVGDGTYFVHSNPVTVSGLTGVQSVASGSAAYHACALRSNGQVACWGMNTSGQVGDGTLTNRATPVVLNVSWLFQMAAGASHTCGLTWGGSSYCWGANNYGQLSDGTTISRLVPTLATNTWSGEEIRLGDGFTVRRRGEATTGVGVNTYGQLGDGTTINRTSPVWTTDGFAWPAAITTGSNHRCAIMVADGAVRCVGRNWYGALGDGTATNRSLPVSAIGISGAKAVGAGDSHTCAITGDAAVWCWGYNMWGQLGDGTAASRYAPVKVLGIDRATALAVGAVHSCALRDDGTVWCWGANYYGQVGDGTYFDRPIATKVKF